ncbi:MAG TPA: lipopolysaccharide kinase InaA family protein [Gemmatimonadaceae bacterium]|nr:lipopolysaccharide kinase InaA family protein [Gemmatimonadaceae bacterium]
MSGTPLPAGYVRVAAGQCSAVVRAEHRADAEAMLGEGTLYEAAARDLAAIPLAGRGVAYAIALPVTGTRAVVRHNRHGGLLAPLTRDLFVSPTRAPYELAIALRLAAAGIRTPEVLMYGVQRPALLLRRSDVVTREIIGGRDLAAYMQPTTSPSDRAAAWAATRELVQALDAAGARHHDLNAKNILLAPGAPGLEAWVLDVDRVEFREPGAKAVRGGNVARLLRSARKWRDEKGAVFDERELEAFGR